MKLYNNNSRRIFIKTFIILITVTLANVSGAQNTIIIPQPVSMAVHKGNFKITPHTVLVAKDAEDVKAARFLNDYLDKIYGFSLPISKKAVRGSIQLTTRKFIKAPDKDAYSLEVNRNGVLIEGDTYAGSFYGIQSLIQLLPVNGVVPGKKGTRSLTVPFVTINDYPGLEYRGMHLDVARHFFPIPFIKKYIDYLALHKMNFFHWHLTDDQGWRIEIKKYPFLTQVGAYRNGTIIGRYPGTGNDNKKYGGYYTQEQVKEIIQYASDRHITVVPEIEMPGHASAAIAAYPWLSCFPTEETIIPSYPSAVSQTMKGKKVQETWGVFDDVFCAGNDSTFTFLQGVIDEVLQLFPSQYIHVGGDECPKSNWKRCPKCQARMKTEGLANEHELQSYFIQRMEKYLNEKGRTLIGWDEILEGGLAPNAWVMSWRGEKGGIEAAKQKHNVIMTPGEYVYFDHSQTRNEDSVTIGGYTPLETVYKYEPIHVELNSADSAYVKGAQANVWTEYIHYPSKVEYMIFPRMSALSEVLWSPKLFRSWKSFEARLPIQFKRYELWGANFSQAFYDLNAQITPGKNNSVNWSIVPKKRGTTVKITGPRNDVHYFTSDSINYILSVPGIYSAQQVVSKTQGKSEKDKLIGRAVNLEYFVNKATGKTVNIEHSPNSKYPGQGGSFSLVNGVYSSKGLSYPDWMGWVGDDLVATIDLEKSQSITSVKMHTLEQNGSWIYLPKYVEVMGSMDGTHFSSLGRSTEFKIDTLTMGWIRVTFPPTTARYIKIIA
ncbi:MAG TPA: family 20 glycosylhydrolase, partial [Flavisolibacter sp.]|nr:family 20 glycosylhydrolase [Flavisolibacter sp.]